MIDLPGVFGVQSLSNRGIVGPWHCPPARQNWSGITTTTNWPAANLAMYCGFWMDAPCLVTKLFWCNGSLASGNVDQGLYNAQGLKLGSTGSTARSAINSFQIVTLAASIFVPAGLVYMAHASDTGANSRTQMVNMASAVTGNQYIIAQEASAFPLPATATFATPTNAVLPVMGGITSRLGY